MADQSPSLKRKRKFNATLTVDIPHISLPISNIADNSMAIPITPTPLNFSNPIIPQIQTENIETDPKTSEQISSLDISNPTFSLLWSPFRQTLPPDLYSLDASLRTTTSLMTPIRQTPILTPLTPNFLNTFAYPMPSPRVNATPYADKLMVASSPTYFNSLHFEPH